MRSRRVSSLHAASKTGLSPALPLLFSFYIHTPCNGFLDFLSTRLNEMGLIGPMRDAKGRRVHLDSKTGSCKARK